MESDEDKPDTSENGPSTYRRLLIPRYPFGIFCVVESNGIFIHAAPRSPSRSRKDSESALPNKRVFHFDRFLAGPTTFGTQISFLSIVRSMRRRDEQGAGERRGELRIGN